MIIFYLLNVILCQKEIFPLQSQLYYSPLDQISLSFQGYEVQIIGESLGFNIQQTIVQGIPQIFNTNGTISTCLAQNTIGLLTQENDNFTAIFYLISTDGTITNQNFVYQQNNSQQDCQALAFVNNTALMHCINNSNNQVILYLINSTYNDTILSPIFINSTFVQSVEIQQHNFASTSDIFFIYNMNYSTIIYKCIYDGGFNEFSKYFQQDSSFLQILINLDGSIFALKEDSLLYFFYEIEKQYHNQNNFAFTSFNVQVIQLKYIYLVYLSIQSEIQVLFFNRIQFYLQDIYLYQQLTFNSQIYLHINYVLVVLDQEIIYFKQSAQMLQMIGFSKVDAFNQFNQYSRLSNLLVSFNQNDGFQLYQIGWPFIYCQSPQQSGLLTLDLYSYTNLYSGTIYVNVTVISNYIGQIIQVYENSDWTIYRFGFNYFQQTIYHSYLGPNISYSLTQGNFESTNYLYTNVMIMVNDDAFVYVHNLNKFNGYLQIAQTNNNDLIFSVCRFGFQDGSSFVLWKYTLSNFNLAISGVSFFDDYNMVIVVILTSKTIFVFDVEPLITVNQTVNYNIATYLGETSLSFISSYQFNRQLFILYSGYLLRIYINEMNINIEMQIQNDDFKYMSGNGLNLFIVEKQTINVYYIDIVSLILVQSYQIADAQIIYVLPIYSGMFIMYESSSTWNLLYLDYSATKQVNIGQNFTTTLNTVGYDFHKTIFTSSEIFFYAIATYNGLTYLNVYRNPLEPIESLYLSIYLTLTEILSLSASTSYITGVDYISIIGVQSSQYIYMIYHFPKVGIFFDYYPLLQYNLTNTFQVSNNVSSLSQTLIIDLNQEYLEIIGIYDQTIYNQTSEQLVIDPLEMFSGVVQNYTVSCDNCSYIQYQSIFSPNYTTINGSNNFVTMSVVNNTQNIYIGNVAEIIQYQFNASQLQSGQLSQYNPNATNSFIAGVAQIIYQFMENNTQSISWLIYQKSVLNISTVYNGVLMNYTLTQINSQVMSAVYQDGFLQIATQQLYYCFIYTIVNSTQNLQVILQNVIIQQVRQFESPFILLFQNLSIIRFGTILQSAAYNLVAILIEVELFQSQYVLNDYRMDTQFFSFLNDITFQITSLSQYDQPYLINDSSFIYLVYVNQIEAKSISLRAQYLSYLDWQSNCQFLLLNSSYKYDFQNVLSASSLYLAIMNIQTEKDDTIGILGIYDISQQCYNNSIVYPFYYFNTTNMTLLTSFLVKFVGNQLVISQNGNTQILTFQAYIVIQYQTTQNSTIAITGQSPISSYTNYMNIQLDPSIIPTPPSPPAPPTPINPKDSNSIFKWYWILLVCLLAIIFIILIIFLITKFTKKSKNDKEGYNNFDEQGIEIKLAAKNSQL